VAWLRCILSLLVQQAIAPKRIVLIFPAMHPTRAALSAGTPSNSHSPSAAPRKIRKRVWRLGTAFRADSFLAEFLGFFAPGHTLIRNNINKIVERFVWSAAQTTTHFMSPGTKSSAVPGIAAAAADAFFPICASERVSPVIFRLPPCHCGCESVCKTHVLFYIIGAAARLFPSCVLR